jgi:hypothetical protein
LLCPIMSQRSRVFNQFLVSFIIIIFVLFLYPAILKWMQIRRSCCSNICRMSMSFIVLKHPSLVVNEKISRSDTWNPLVILFSCCKVSFMVRRFKWCHCASRLQVMKGIIPWEARDNNNCCWESLLPNSFLLLPLEIKMLSLLINLITWLILNL